MESAALPERLPPASTPPICWKSEYSEGAGGATVWACGYRVSGSAFDALQRMNSAPDEVKFQKGRYLVIAKWANVTNAEITELVGAVQRGLPNK